MKNLLLATLALLLISTPALLAQNAVPKVKEFTHKHFEGWLTSYAKAQEEAKVQKKPLLILFTGSDWCPPCMFIEKNVLSKKEFMDFAKKDLVLFVADSPNKTQMPEDYAAQVEALSGQFQVEGVPTFILLSPEGRELSKKVGAFAQKPDEFIAWVKSSTKK
ncbi:MAG: thioredoxin family protein [Verrucomicrobiae bacterium]|nr:thioredoxin family protein [Verrucomicrobiae bacterium]